MRTSQKILILASMLILACLAAWQSTALADESCDNLNAGFEKSEQTLRALSDIDTKTNDKIAFRKTMYEASKILETSGDILFRTSNEFENDCIASLREEKKLLQVPEIFAKFLDNMKLVDAFLENAKNNALQLGLQQDFDSLGIAINDYRAVTLKILASCEKYAENYAPECAKKLDASGLR